MPTRTQCFAPPDIGAHRGQPTDPIALRLPGPRCGMSPDKDNLQER